MLFYFFITFFKNAVQLSAAKKTAFFVFLCVFIFSCANKPSSIPSETSEAYIRPAENTFEKNPMTEEKNIETPDKRERAFFMAETNSLPKYFRADKDDIQVFSDIYIENKKFIVKYDLIRAELKQYSPERSHFSVPFSLEDEESRTKQDGIIYWEAKDDETGLLLSFDDDYFESWEENFNLFDRYEAKVTFFVQGKPLAFCKRALARGHDVGYHTINHLNLPQVSRNVFTQETLSEIGAFRNAGVPLHAFAYPYGLFEAWMHENLLLSFKILRGYGVTFRIYNAESMKKGFVAAKAIDNILYKDEEAFKSSIRLMLRTVKFIGDRSVLPLCTHNIADSADWGIKRSRLKYTLETASELHLRFYRYRDFFAP